MTSKAARRRARRGGRRRIVNVPRQPDGRVRPQHRVHDIQKTVREAWQRVYRLTEEQSKQKEAGCAIGRAYLRGELNYTQYQAGCIAALVVSNYYRLKGFPPPTTQAINLVRVPISSNGGQSNLEPPQHAIDRAEDHYMRLQLAMRVDGINWAASQSTIQFACVEDREFKGWPPHMIRFLEQTLDSIANEFSTWVMPEKQGEQEKN